MVGNLDPPDDPSIDGRYARAATYFEMCWQALEVQPKGDTSVTIFDVTLDDVKGWQQHAATRLQQQREEVEKEKQEQNEQGHQEREL